MRNVTHHRLGICTLDRNNNKDEIDGGIDVTAMTGNGEGLP